jgi:hypothetical protein
MICVAAPALAAVPIAIKCEGQWEKTDEVTRKTSSSRDVRIYIIDEEGSQVSYWNDAFGRSFSLCETFGHACKFNFFPNMIMSDTTSEGSDTLHVIIDRVAGTYFEMGSSILGSHKFKGVCSPTAMPSVDVAKRKF